MTVESARLIQLEKHQQSDDIVLPVLTSALLRNPLTRVTKLERTRMKHQSYGFPHETSLGTLVPLDEYRETVRSLHNRMSATIRHIGHHVEFYIPRICSGSPLYDNAEAGRYLSSPRLLLWNDGSRDEYLTMRHDFELSGVTTHLSNDVVFVDQDDRIKLRFAKYAVSAFMATFQMEDSLRLVNRIVAGLEIAANAKPMVPKPHPLETYPIYTSREYQKRTVVDIEPYNPAYLGEKPSREDFKAI